MWTSYNFRAIFIHTQMCVRIFINWNLPLTTILQYRHDKTNPVYFGCKMFVEMSQWQEELCVCTHTFYSLSCGGECSFSITYWWFFCPLCCYITIFHFLPNLLINNKFCCVCVLFFSVHFFMYLLLFSPIKWHKWPIVHKNNKLIIQH